MSTTTANPIDTGPARSRKRTVVGLLAFAMFAVVMVSVEFLTARGQFEFGRRYMHLDGVEAITAYFALQGLMLGTAFLALWAVLARDSYFMHRVWTGVFLLAAAAASYLGAHAAGWPTTGALFTAGFSIAALRTWHAILKRIRRDAEPHVPLLRFPILRYVLAFRETASAARLSYIDSIPPAEALDLIRAHTPRPHAVTDDGRDVRELVKADAWAAAYAAVGDYDVAKALAWLIERGVKTDRSYGYEIRNKLTAQRRGELRAVTGGARPAKKAPAPATTDADASKVEPPATSKRRSRKAV